MSKVQPTQVLKMMQYIVTDIEIYSQYSAKKTSYKTACMTVFDEK